MYVSPTLNFEVKLEFWPILDLYLIQKFTSLMRPGLGEVVKNQIVYRNPGRPGPRAARPDLEGWVRPPQSFQKWNEYIIFIMIRL